MRGHSPLLTPSQMPWVGEWMRVTGEERRTEENRKKEGRMVRSGKPHLERLPTLTTSVGDCLGLPPALEKGSKGGLAGCKGSDPSTNRRTDRLTDRLTDSLRDGRKEARLSEDRGGGAHRSTHLGPRSDDGWQAGRQGSVVDPRTPDPIRLVGKRASKPCKARCRSRCRTWCSVSSLPPSLTLSQPSTLPWLAG